MKDVAAIVAGGAALLASDNIFIAAAAMVIAYEVAEFAIGRWRTRGMSPTELGAYRRAHSNDMLEQRAQARERMAARVHRWSPRVADWLTNEARLDRRQIRFNDDDTTAGDWS